MSSISKEKETIYAMFLLNKARASISRSVLSSVPCQQKLALLKDARECLDALERTTSLHRLSYRDVGTSPREFEKLCCRAAERPRGLTAEELLSMLDGDL